MIGGPAVPDRPPSLDTHPLVRIVSAAVKDQTWSGGIVAAVSGGRDSVALALALRACGTDPAAVTIAHVHHHRRAEADLEAESVQQLAQNLGCAFELRHVRLGDSATPATLRDARYEALLDVAVSGGATVVATPHQAEDQLETTLLALVRGAGPRGLVGMRPRRPLGCGVDLVRPMLRCSRAQAADLCTLAGVAWHDDPTNVDPKTLRGRLRRDVLPLLEEIRPGVARRLAAGTALRASAADALAERVVRPQDGRWSRETLAAASEGIRIASIDAAARMLAGGSDGLSGETIRCAAAAIVDQKRHRRLFELGSGVMFVVEAEVVRIDQARQPIESRPPM